MNARRQPKARRGAPCRSALVGAMLLLPLGGCLPMMAANVAGSAAGSLRKAPESNAALRPQALEACSARAAAYGTPRIIDSEQRSIDRIIVWGVVTEASGQRSFECSFGKAVTGFTLRSIRSKP